MADQRLGLDELLTGRDGVPERLIPVVLGEAYLLVDLLHENVEPTRDG
jgi:hypothetical protein